MSSDPQEGHVIVKHNALVPKHIVWVCVFLFFTMPNIAKFSGCFKMVYIGFSNRSNCLVGNTLF